MTKTILFLYRDGANYKFPFRAIVENADDLKEGDQILYKTLGMSRNFFHKNVVNYPYDQETDHDSLDIVKVEDEEDATVSLRVKVRKSVTTNPVHISKLINELGQKYKIHDTTLWNHSDRIKMFLDNLKGSIKKMEYNQS